MTQEAALTILKTGGNVFLTGEPGSGKSHTINAYVAYLRSFSIEPAITASTGIAATHIGGQTIHSWSGIGIKSALTEYDIDRIASTEYLVKRISKTKVLIIDEVSMLPAETLNSIDAVCRSIKHSEEPFGGIQVVFVGDFFQLPPVRKFSSLSTGSGQEFAFTANSWKAANSIVCYLTEQHRQEDPIFLELLTALRRNEANESHSHILDERIQDVESFDHEGITKLFSHNEDVDRINTLALGQIEGDEKHFKMTSTGREALVAQLTKGCLSPEELVLKVGAVVMFTKNAQNGTYVNGTLGEVIGFETESRYPIVRTRKGSEIVAEPVEWIVEDNGKRLASIKQIPLRLAWAMTVHKSQGMSLDAAYVDLRGAFVEGQGYVALSRVRTLGGLYLAGYNARALQVHPEVLEVDDEFRTYSELVRERFEGIAKDDLAKLHKNFILASGGKIDTPRQARGKQGKPSNAGKRWLAEDDKRLEEEFKNGKSVGALMKIFDRKRGGITARLEKLGLIEPTRYRDDQA
ncbi:AAA family ATPase [Candidatus Parcubacteria bacterium]|nr:AAA family ATPase [Candidatus Parcubacteria bacterium]